MNIPDMITATSEAIDKMTPAERLRAALILAITAPDDNKAEDAVNMARYFARFVSDETVEQIKRDIERGLSKDTVNNAA
jgi:enoyl-CoA hydratase/carnithine racemase